MRRMKRSAASTTPTVTEITMSKTHGEPEAGEQHERRRCAGATRTTWTKCLSSLMFQATRRSSAASEAMGR